MVQGQRRMLGIWRVLRTQPGNHRVHCDVGKTKCCCCKHVCYAWIRFGIIILVRRHQEGHGSITENLGQVVVPR